MSKPLERSCGRGIRSSMPKAAISDSGFGMKSRARWQGSAVRNWHKWECRPDVPQHSLHDPVDAKSVVGPISTVRPKPASPGASVAPQTCRKFGALDSDEKCQILTLRSGMGELHSVEGWLKPTRYSGAILDPIGG
jgi:hypothetical protein